MGRIVDRKGVNELYDAFIEINKEFPNTKLVVVGKANLEQVRDKNLVKKMEDELRIIHEGGDRDGLCWSKLVEYNYASATSESKESLKDYFRKPLKETVLVDDFILMPVSIHPCMEALINLYGETKEEIFIDRARELNEAMLEKNIKKTSNCDVKGSSILVAGSNENIIHEGHYLADSAYQTYLMTRPGFIDEEITIR